MRSLFTHLPRKCGGLRWKAVTKGLHTTQTYCQQAKIKAHNKHYLRSPYSLIHHYYKDIGTLQEAVVFVKNFPSLMDVPQPQLESIIKLLKKDGHCWKEVELFKHVLLFSPVKYSQRVQLLQNLSLYQPSLQQVLWMNVFMNSSVKSLRENPENIFKSDPVEHLIAASFNLNLPESILQGARDLSNRDGSVTMKQVFFYLIKHYLAQRFSEDRDVVGSFLDSVQPSFLWKPLDYYPVICDILIHCLELSFSEVQEQPQWFLLDPENTKDIMQKFPNIGGTPIRDVVKAVPELLQVPTSHLRRWLRLLHKHRVHHFTCTDHTAALFKTKSFLKVDERLQILKRLQEWEVIMASTQLFEILRHQECIKRLLNITESGQIISNLSAAIRPNQGLRLKQCYKVTPEVVSYVATTLGLPLEQMREVLAEDIYTPFGITNTKTVLRLLLDYGFTREQVVAGALVLNLEAGIVEQALKDLHTRPEAQPFAEWMENPFVLHLLAYCIKKDIPHMDLPLKK